MENNDFSKSNAELSKSYWVNYIDVFFSQRNTDTEYGRFNKLYDKNHGTPSWWLLNTKMHY